MSEEAYKTAWRELREWLGVVKVEEQNKSNSTSETIYGAVCAGYSAMSNKAIKKMRELEKSHVLD